MPPPPAVSAVRGAVRRLLGSAEAAPFRGAPLVVACSGGADSLALAAAASHAARRAGVALHGLVVDHGLQVGSADVAARAAQQLAELGAVAEVVRVQVGSSGGPEAAARRARYRVLRERRPPGSLVLLGHTLDDQAESVLLGLGRGSGARSIAGMRPLDPPWARPFLGVRRETTEAACRELGLDPWRDPHNADARFTRVRLRTEVLPLMEEVLQGGVHEALARTAQQLREDADALDAVAAAERRRVEVGEGLDALALKEIPAAVRRRVLKAWLLDRGVPELSDAHLRAADALLADWRGQGGPRLPGDFVLRRAHGTLQVEAAGRKPPNG
ncbi:tRNA lysidine(34) synthetase TilS [Saccharopolyspora hirsuta]|uniref:tRNA(Ile)-lysidine synthase n=1 Tax=Saccharopolyspora hirsuta TaxID=1837 RepID=A0A5M7BIW0_SACHI|nr:tRNA lysidine(34) synthetase TilS [Saccharopolyspora hirsuta]KAA5829622.1 tRNA lysidine(34) synthetase TilS [Saccharopolyspora hirsuta]MBF6511010.1 tRNA lysidine(34) synthetase TilS [Nocardia farcinica]